MEKRVLIVVDFEKDFVDGKLPNSMAAEIDEGIAKKVRWAKENGYYIVFLFDRHGEDYMETQEGRKLPVPHCDTKEGRALYGKTGKAANEIGLDMNNIGKEIRPVMGFYKAGFGFAYLGLMLRGIINSYTLETEDEQVNRHGEGWSIEFAGVVTNMCVISNVVIAKAELKEAEIYVHEKLCASNERELHYKAIDVMESMQVNIIREE